MSGLLAKLTGVIGSRAQQISAANFGVQAQEVAQKFNSATATAALLTGAAADATLKDLAKSNPTFANTLSDLKSAGYDMQVKAPVVFASKPGEVAQEKAARFAQAHAAKLDNDPVFADAKRRNDNLESPLPLVITLKDGDAKGGVSSAFGHDADGAQGGVVKAEVNVSSGSFAGPQLGDAVGQYRNVLSVVEGMQKHTGLTDLVAVS